ncbi:hypothetical protein [Acinetobacter marinus]|nr:hypothetical protein [Acinetobacter marinus]
MLKLLRAYFQIDRTAYNQKLALMVRVANVIFIASFVIVLFLKHADTFKNPLALLFTFCIFGSVVYLTHHLSLQIIDGKPQAKRNTFGFVLFTLFLYGELHIALYLLVICYVLLMCYLMMGQNWQDQRDIYLGRFRR